jgi:CheY-like chemotaxis protein
MAAILIIDDNEDLRFVLRTLLAHYGHAVHEANGAFGLRKALEVLPDVIVVDLSMQSNGGWRAAASLKSNPTTLGIPLVALSNRPPDVERRTAPDGYFAECLQLPADLKVLLRAIERTVRERPAFKTRIAPIVEESKISARK